MGLQTCPIVIEGIKEMPTRDIKILVVDGIKNTNTYIK